MSSVSAKTKHAANNMVSDTDIEGRFEHAKNEFYKLADTLTEMGSAKAREFKEMAAHTASSIKSDVNDVSGDAIDNFLAQVASIEKDMAKRVREKPLHALALAGSVGFLIALLSRR